MAMLFMNPRRVRSPAATLALPLPSSFCSAVRSRAIFKLPKADGGGYGTYGTYRTDGTYGQNALSRRRLKTADTIASRPNHRPLRVVIRANRATISITFLLTTR